MSLFQETQPVEPIGVLAFDLPKIADGLVLPPETVARIFRDGRQGQPLVLERLAVTLTSMGWSLADRSGGSAVFVSPEGQLWDTRVLTLELSLAPSRMKGTGRRFDPEGFRAYLETRGGVLVVDVLAFPSCTWWLVPRGKLLGWDRLERGRVDRYQARTLLAGIALDATLALR